LADVHVDDGGREGVLEADLRAAAGDRHLAAFEPALDAAGARLLALLAATGRLAVAGARTATDADGLLLRTRAGLQVGKDRHRYLPLRAAFTGASWTSSTSTRWRTF